MIYLFFLFIDTLYFYYCCIEKMLSEGTCKQNRHRRFFFTTTIIWHQCTTIYQLSCNPFIRIYYVSFFLYFVSCLYYFNRIWFTMKIFLFSWVEGRVTISGVVFLLRKFDFLAAPYTFQLIELLFLYLDGEI